MNEERSESQRVLVAQFLVIGDATDAGRRAPPRSSALKGLHVRGHEKVPTGGHVEVPTLD